MMKLMLSLLLLSGTAYAAEDKLTGEVVDITCYTGHESKGEKHATCAAKCLSKGLPAGLLSDGKLYVITTADHSSPSQKLSKWAGKNVTITGTKIEKDGMNVIEMASVAPATATAPAPAASPTK